MQDVNDKIIPYNEADIIKTAVMRKTEYETLSLCH